MIKAIVTDIEGTTSSISFVHDVLFPYAKQHMADFVRQADQLNDIEQQETDLQLDEVARLAEIPRDDIEGLIQQLINWIEEDKKITPLKALQGMIWRQGYQQGDFVGHVYKDAADYLKRWHDQGIDLYVYSSGSVSAQKLIFGYTDFGDLTPLFKGYFDTQIGGKREVESYRHIIDKIGLKGEEILFLSDIEQELEAASQASMKTCWLIRKNDSKMSIHEAAKRYLVARDFSEIVV
ncbi:acireductone synthase [Alkalimarinus sediminis]|uniref:Enolase-phosphatase E1 n=1 Tax=Alkalimarinus sediminis TaxID=1632866 RepID=A0A9E8HJ32_9ALTE|nr:acireductone synthase [Alkalimarinus sediminis]UZW75600.1 acireductone synthase [Alkalimarinus sediminis]